MKIEKLWLVFLTFVSAVVLWFTLDTGYKLYLWTTQTHKANPLSISWELDKQASDRFALAANYTFLHKGKEIAGNTIFQNERYRNEETANYFLNQNKKKEWIVFYSPFHLKNSTLNRFFPLKSCIYTAIVWCILIYFFWLSHYVGKNFR